MRPAPRNVRRREPAPPDVERRSVLKPKHSGFFASTLDTLLEALHIRRVILTGIAGNICVLFTANDAYMRDLKVFTPSDCIVSNTPAENRYALEHMRTVLQANIMPFSEIDWSKLRQRTD